MTEGHSSHNKKQRQRDEVERGKEGRMEEKPSGGERTSENDRDKKRKGEKERGEDAGGERQRVCGERFYHSYYFEETALIHTPCEQLTSVIHQQDAFMRWCRGNIMLTALSF